MFIGRVEARAVNVLLRAVGIVVALGSSAAILILVADIIRSSSGESVLGILLMAGVLAFGVVLLRMRSFRPDRTEPRAGERVTWWTGDPVK
jgi:Zn-dependent membrane protease YugP